MQQLVDDLTIFCRTHWCRCEVRTNTTTKEEGVVFVDLGTSDANMCTLVRHLRRYVAGLSIAMHTSKYQSPTIRAAIEAAGMQLVGPGTIYYDDVGSCEA